MTSCASPVWRAAVYPILADLEGYGWVASRWQSESNGSPVRRRVFTRAGRISARELLAHSRAVSRMHPIRPLPAAALLRLVPRWAMR